METIYNSKQAKINHISNLEGTTEYEVVLLAAVFITSYWMWKVVAMKLNKTFYAMEYLLLALPLLLSTTLLSDHIERLLLAQFLGIVFLHVLGPLPFKRVVAGKQESFINAARCFLQFSTCIAILAVDFHSFPRRFAKTEKYGVSWMDVGVGAFVFSSGLVSGSRTQMKATSLWKTLRLSLPALLLGLLRLLSTKSLDYQEHESEYGVHWNFFMTLGILPILVNLQNVLIGRQFQLVVGGFIICLYQYALTFWGLEEYILHAPRVNLISMNREGLCSLVGM